MGRGGLRAAFFDNIKKFTINSLMPNVDTAVSLSYSDIDRVTHKSWEALTAREGKEDILAIAKISIRNVSGIVDIFDVCVKRSLYKGGFEMT